MMDETEKLVSFTKGFIGLDEKDIKTCLKTVSDKHDISIRYTSRQLLSIINNEEKSCIGYSKDKSLFDYQQRVVESFYSSRGIIAAFATGTGKTITAVSSAACVHNLAKVFGKKCNILIVTPSSLVNNMKEEFKKFNYDFGKDIDIISSNIFRDILLYKKLRRQGVNPNANKFMITNSKRTINIECNENTFLIIDEAHEFKTDYQYIFAEKPPFGEKDIESRAKMFVEECYPKVWKILLLTATPMLNRWYDIMNLIAAVKGVSPRTQYDKINIVPVTLDVNNTTFGSTIGVDSIHYGQVRLTDPTYFKGVIAFKDIDKTNRNFPIRNPEIYKPVRMTDSYYNQVKTMLDAISAKRPKRKKMSDVQIQKELESMQKKMAELPDNPKIHTVAQIISSRNYDKVLIYSRFVSSLKGLKKNIDEMIENEKIPLFETFIITGKDVPPAKRQEYLRNINDTKKAIIFVSDAGGIGLDFKEIEAVIIYEPGINMSREEQAIGRAVRFKSHISLPNEKRRVDIYKLISLYPIYVQDQKTPDQTVALRAQQKELESQYLKLALERLNRNEPYVPKPKIDSSPILKIRY